MKKISLIFKDDRDADAWRTAYIESHQSTFFSLTHKATIQVSKRKRKAVINKATL